MNGSSDKKPRPARPRHEWLRLLLVLVPTLALCFGVGRLTISAETRVLAGPENPVRQSLEAFEGRFTQNNNLLFVVVPGAGAILDPASLAFMEALTEGAWGLPRIQRVDSVTAFPLIESDGISFGVFTAGSRLDGTTAQITRLQEQIRTEPWLNGALLNEDGNVAGVNAQFVLPPEATVEIAEIMGAVDELLTGLNDQYPDFEVHVTGNVALMNAFAESARRDLSLLIPAALLLVVVIATVFLRDAFLVTALGVYLTLCSAGAMGAAGWAGHILNPATVAAPIIIMTLGLASIIHMLSGVQAGRARGLDTSDAVDRAVRENLFPITITITTTAIGFLFMNAAASPPLRELGNIVVVGLGIALMLALFAMPMVLRRLPVGVRTIETKQMLSRMIGVVERRQTFVLMSAFVLVVISGAGVLRTKLDDDFIRYFDESFAYRVASDVAEDRLTGLNILEFAFEAEISHGINEPAYMQRLDAFASWLGAQPEVAHVTSLSDKLRQINGALTGTAVIPETREEVAQQLLLFELSLPAGNDIADRINAQRNATRVTALLRHVTSAQIRELNGRASAWLGENNPITDQAPGHSINYFFARLSLANIQSMVGGTVGALILISLIVMVALRDVRLGLVSMISNLLPIIVGFGLWGHFVGELGLASSVVAAMTFGIVVDDTVHLLLRYRAERAAGRNVHEAITNAYVSVGRAVIITSLALTGGFLLLAVSGFEINASLGLFTGLIVMAALAIVLTVVPALVLATRRAPVAKRGKLP